MFRRVVAALPLAVLVITGVATAAPAVDRVGGATAAFALVGRDDARYTVQVQARVSEVGTRAGTGSVRVSVTRCKAGTCSPRFDTSAVLKGNQFAIAQDLSSGSLTLTLFGKPLVLMWSDTSGETEADGKVEAYQPVLPQGQVRVWARQTRSAQVDGRVAGVRCRAREGTVLREEIVDGVTESLPPRLASSPPRHLAGLLTARCT